MRSPLYDSDFYAWSREQAELLRSGRLAQADIEHIAEEIDSMGRTEKRELVSRLTVLLLRLLKWRCQPGKRGPSWEATIANQRASDPERMPEEPSQRKTHTSTRKLHDQASRSAPKHSQVDNAPSVGSQLEAKFV